MKVVFMFSGQGSHYYQMGKELYETDSTFRSELQRADSLFQEMTQRSVISEIYSEKYLKSDLFSNTLLTHPAIFMIEYALARVLLHRGITPSYVLGASLGEFAAAVVSEILSFDSALKAVVNQSIALVNYCEQGKMLAILHPPYETCATIASVNFSSHFVVSGKRKEIEDLERDLIDQKMTFQALAVERAFHSPAIDSASKYFLEAMKGERLNPCSVPFISCAEKQVCTPDSPAHFWNCVRKPMDFFATIEKMEREGSYTYIDLGPSGTLATFVKQILTPASKSRAFATLTPYGKDQANLSRLVYC